MIRNLKSKIEKLKSNGSTECAGKSGQNDQMIWTFLRFKFSFSGREIKILTFCDSKVIAIVVALATVASYETLAQGQELSKISRIGYVRSFGSGMGRQYTAFQQGLRDLGYIEGKTY
jgi:hypothetical protein